MSDYKDRIQQRAEELAFARYEIWFYDLPEKERDAIYEEARQDVIEGYRGLADRR